MYAQLSVVGSTGSIPPQPIYGLPVAKIVRSLDTVRELKNGKTVTVGRLSSAEQFAQGWREFTEDGVESEFKAGLPVDVIVNDKVRRTYPNKTYRDIDVLKGRVYEAIEAKFEEVAQNGIIFTAGSIPLPSTLQMQSFLLMVVTAVDGGEPFPVNFKVRDMNGVLRSVNEAQFRAYQNQVAVHLFQARKNANAHLEAVEALVDPALVVSYDYSGGWPANPVVS